MRARKAALLKEKRGEAMILAICIMAMLSAFSLIMTFSASALAARQITSAQKQVRKASLESFQRALSDQLLLLPGEQSVGGLYDYLWDNMEVFDKTDVNRWDYYNPEETGHTELDDLTRTFTAQGESGMTYQIQIYWTCSNEAMEYGLDSWRYGHVELIMTVSALDSSGQTLEKIKTTYKANVYNEEGVEANVQWYVKTINE
ncbi:MAG: hypothetical protein GX061_07260 [Eubacteriaceae bacterium]|nr:hypothetical protein [Eubacteriaceae bacterium]